MKFKNCAQKIVNTSNACMDNLPIRDLALRMRCDSTSPQGVTPAKRPYLPFSYH